MMFRRIMFFTDEGEGQFRTLDTFSRPQLAAIRARPFLDHQQPDLERQARVQVAILLAAPDDCFPA